MDNDEERDGKAICEDIYKRGKEKKSKLDVR